MGHQTHLPSNLSLLLDGVSALKVVRDVDVFELIVAIADVIDEATDSAREDGLVLKGQNGGRARLEVTGRVGHSQTFESGTGYKK